MRDCAVIRVLRCGSCGLVFLDSMDHVGEKEYYCTEFGKDVYGDWTWQQYLNQSRQDDERRFQMIKPMLNNRSYLDVGCGAGGVVSAASKLCKRVSAVEPMERWNHFLRDGGVDVFSSVDELGDAKFDIVTLFHVLEHIADPIPFLKTLREKLSDNGTLVIEVPNVEDVLITLYDSKPFSEFTYWSPHLYYYSAGTLKTLLMRAGFANVNIQQCQRYPLSNHLKWLSQGKPGGHVDWSFIDSPELSSAYESQLSKLNMCDTLVAWIKM